MKTQIARAAANTTGGLESLLGPGEKVLWKGKPMRQGFILRTWPLSVFGVLLVVSVLCFVTVILTTEAPDWLSLYAIPFGLAGLYMLAGHFLVTWYEWSQTEYMVTGSRVLIRHGVFSPTITVYSVLGLPHTEVEMHGPDVGNIMFKPPRGEGYGPWPGYQTMWPYTPGYLVGLLYVHHPEDVRSIIERARDGPV